MWAFLTPSSLNLSAIRIWLFGFLCLLTLSARAADNSDVKILSPCSESEQFGYCSSRDDLTMWRTI